VAKIGPRVRKKAAEFVPAAPRRAGIGLADSEGTVTASFTKTREIAVAIVFDTAGRLLLQQRDNAPNILYPGKIGLFGGHRVGAETFLECMVREIHEELSCYLPPERFEPIASRMGPDSAVPGGTVHAEFFVVREVPVDKLKVTEGSLKIVQVSELDEIGNDLTPSARFAFQSFFGRS
jgi:8-oxo-dGTP diphosphatase